jgi:Zn-dependent protease
MKDERFAVLTLLAACATVALVAIHHGLGAQQAAGWVGLAAGAALFFELFRRLAIRVLPNADPITQLNFGTSLAVGTVTFVVAVVALPQETRRQSGLGWLLP